jgi:hypothetical protein
VLLTGVSCETAVGTLGFKEKHLILNDWIASKVVLFRFHNGDSLAEGASRSQQASVVVGSPKAAPLPTCTHPHCQNVRWAKFSFSRNPHKRLHWNVLRIVIGIAGYQVSGAVSTVSTFKTLPSASL